MLLAVKGIEQLMIPRGRVELEDIAWAASQRGGIPDECAVLERIIPLTFAAAHVLR
jgi:hypothetical protein